MEIRSIEIDFDKNVLKINGEYFTDRPVIATLPGSDGWDLKKLFNPRLSTGSPEECDKLEISYTRS